jgi:hypothetical protein
MNERNLKAIPVAACRMACGEVEFRDNGPNAKSASIRLKARSGGSIDHWYWGKVVHDLAGMRLHKPRLTVDYAHNESEVLGYLNHFDTESGDLIASGALTPWREDDRASEVMFKMREGVPYEASIFFGGDGMKVQEIAGGQIEQVNGRQFEGPGIIIREWPLRGVAICPYGADSNTESVTMGAGETVTAQEWKHEKEKEIEQMTAEKPAVEAEPVVEALAAVETPVVEAEAKPTVESVTAQLTDSASRLTASEAQRVTLTTERDEARTALSAAQAEIAELRNQKDAADKARVDAEAKLTAITSGQPPVSAAPAEGKEPTSWMERARKNKKG